MNSELKHIDAALLKRYYDGQMTGAEKNALEQMALDDPFLKDAMEGFEANPGSFDTFYQNQLIRQQKFGYGYFIAGGILTVGLIAVLVVFHEPADVPGQEQAQLSDSSMVTREVEIIPEEIDTLQVVPQAEMISATEIAENKTEIQKTITYPVIIGEGPIVVEEDVVVMDDLEIVPEKNRDYNLVENVPATYLSDLFVVDYRRIKRDRDLITYTKYEFTGTSAEFENELSEQNADFIEKQVDVPYFEYLEKSMQNFAAGDYKKSLSGYLIILEQYKEDLNALFYGGLCYYNLQRYEKSLAFFDQILAQNLNAFKEEAAWYKVKSLLKLKRTDEARKVLDDIIAGGGFYVKEAIALRKTL